MAEVSSVLALLVAVALMALSVAAYEWLRRVEAWREKVRRLAWHAAQEVEAAEREEAYRYGQYGEFVRLEAPLLWTAPVVPPAEAPMVAPAEAPVVAPADAPVVAPVEAPPPPPAPPAAGNRVCAMCGRQTTLRCKRCKSVKYCTFKCQAAHWREGHKDECHPPSVGARQDDTKENVMTGIEPEVKGMPSDKEFNTAETSSDGCGNLKFRFSLAEDVNVD